MSWSFCELLPFGQQHCHHLYNYFSIQVANIIIMWRLGVNAEMLKGHISPSDNGLREELNYLFLAHKIDRLN